MLIQMIGNYPDPSFPPNSVIDWPEEEAKRMISLGLVREFAVVPVPPSKAELLPLNLEKAAPTKKPKKG